MIFSKHTLPALLTLISSEAFAQSEWVAKVSGTSAQLNSVAWTGHRLVVGSSGGPRTSPDGEHWYRGPGSGTTWVASTGHEVVSTGTLISPKATLDGVSPYDKVCFGFFSGGCLGGYYYSYYGLFDYSETSSSGELDTTSWRFTPFNPYDNISLKAVVRTDSNIVRDVVVTSRWVGLGANGAVSVSYNKSDWTTFASGAQDLSALVWTGSSDPASGQYVAVGPNGTILTSSDGLKWIAQTSGTTESLLSVVWCGSQFVVVGSNGMILTSPDGVNWAWRTSGTDKTLRSVIWCGSEFVAVGDGGVILTSPDGFEWTSRTSGTEMNLNSVVWTGTQYVAVGDSGTILTSQLDQAELPTAIQPFSNSSAKLSLHLTPSTLLVDLPNSMMGKQIRATIYTVNGNKVRSVQANGSDRHVSLPVTSVPPGIYLFEVAGPDARVVQSFQILR